MNNMILMRNYTVFFIILEILQNNQEFEFNIYKLKISLSGKNI